VFIEAKWDPGHTGISPDDISDCGDEALSQLWRVDASFCQEPVVLQDDENAHVLSPLPSGSSPKCDLWFSS